MYWWPAAGMFFQWNEHRWPSVLTVFENNDDCSAIIFAAPLKNSFPYKTAAHSCNSQTFLPNMSNL